MTVKDALRAIPSPTGCDMTFDLEKILTDDFISSVTDCADADALFSGVQFDGQQGFENMDVALLDQIVAEHSSVYGTFADLIQAAVSRYLRTK